MSTSLQPEQAGRVRAVVGAHIEPVTRFDAESLNELEAEKAFAASLTLTLDQAVSLSKQMGTWPGGLPAGVDKVANRAELDAELDVRLNRATHEAPQAAQAWAQANAGTYRRLMPGINAFLSAPGSVGFQHRCVNCDGDKQVKCTACSGKGRSDCARCTHSGRIDCYQCRGNKTMRCTAYPCNGRGRWTEYENQSVWSEAEGRHHTVSVITDHSCTVCSGSGQVTCYQCEYDGKVRCPDCSGDGYIWCRICGRTGHVDCTGCAVTGIQHVRGTIKATVQPAERIEIHTDNAELRQLLATRLSPDELPGFGGLDQATIQTQGMHLRTTHQLHVDVREAHFHVGADTFVLHGFGPEVRVFDFKNIAGRLLEEDLQTLEQGLSGTSRWRRQRGGGLLNHTADFLRSELNMLIAEQVAANRDAPEEANAAVQAHFGGLVDASYIARANRALQGAITRLYGAELFEPAVSLCGLAALLTILSFLLGWPRYEVWPTLLATLAGGGLVWLVLEWWTRRRIARHFEGDYGQRVIAQLKNQGNIRRWRIGMAVALPACMLSALVATAMLPPVQALRQTYRDELQSDGLLQEWLSFGAAVDLQQRRYPAHAQLIKKAEQGNQQAIVVLAWELLLGANHTPKNVAEAGRWLDRVRPEITQSTYWNTAKAVQVLNEDSTPEALRKAASDLSEASDKGFAEASYWLARLYLAANSPLRDERQGIHYLTKAADKYHVHAALLLGQKYAQGEGLKRNSNTARRYLERAFTGGLPEAQEALKALSQQK
jgi:hypothetical protein